MRFFEPGTRALVLGAHTDDEFGCAGTIARMVESGVEVHYACFSSCAESVPQGFDRDVLKREVRLAMCTLGISEERFTLFDYPVRHFPRLRQEILEDLVRLRAAIHPHVVFVPAFSDTHQDHEVVAREAFRAFKHVTLLGYELPMNTISFTNACFIALEDRHLEAKLRHAHTYVSQAFRRYLAEDFIRGLAIVRGLQIDAAAAEAFEAIRITMGFDNA